MKYCKQCGSQVNENAAFCIKCGCKITGSEATNTSVPNGVKTKYCPHCGSVVNEKAVVCVACGCSLAKNVVSDTSEPSGAKKKYCPGCGSEVNETAIICTKCGYSLTFGGISPSQNKNDQVLVDVEASYNQGTIKSGGRFVLTTRRIMFYLIPVSSGKGIEIPLTDIVHVERKRTILGLSDRDMTVVVKSYAGINFHFKNKVDREQVLFHITELLTNRND